ncbi:MAG: CRISPR-associated endoribonuclease Cas6 [Candidatus Aenigmarchaeota archaeon ex4484_52]|nr:MAG: CRISPR-associated endoribonuclease Cas6 [Candidatus Aenigmarchaeota archaeon ex4484_52]
MRLKICFTTNSVFEYRDINKYLIQSFIWNLLKNTEFVTWHDKKTFKFFTFSNIFPITDFKKNEEKTLIISSPNKPIMFVLYRKLKERKKFELGIHNFLITKLNLFEIKLRTKWICGTPIALYKDNKNNQYYTPKKNPDIMFFLRRIKENAVKKYNAFYKEDLKFDGNLFDKLTYVKSVCVCLRKNKKDFVIIGTLWKNLEKKFYNKDEIKFYKFIMDCGIGEKNSLGFGFMNTIIN